MAFDVEKVQFSPEELQIGMSAQRIYEVVSDGFQSTDLIELGSLRELITYLFVGHPEAEVADRFLDLAFMLKRNNWDISEMVDQGVEEEEV